MKLNNLQKNFCIFFQLLYRLLLELYSGEKKENKMALIQRNVEQLRREGIKNAQKRIDEEKAFEAKVQALSKHNVGRLYDLREIIKSKELKQTRNFLDLETAQEELQMLLHRFGLHTIDSQVMEFAEACLETPYLESGNWRSRQLEADWRSVACVLSLITAQF